MRIWRWEEFSRRDEFSTTPALWLITCNSFCGFKTVS